MSDPIHAPELTGATAWLNTTAPLSLRALRGKIVLLDFWTYGCVNCQHVLPDLKRLEAKYRDELVVIGVHSPKFDNEKSVDNLRRIVQRYGIAHPVAQDTDFRIWRAYTVRAWPTLVLIDPAGYIVATAAGEGHGAAIDQAIDAVVAVFDERDALDRRPLASLVAERDVEDGVLKFPGKIAADASSDRLFIADSNHNRIVIAQADGQILDVAGQGDAGRRDGAFDSAMFYRPQGLAFDEVTSTLYVADTSNHLVRAVDLNARTVTTVAGTGAQGVWGGDGGAARAADMSSPWDLALWRRDAGPVLFIAMAGFHQIWMLDVARNLVFPYAGSGREARLDGGLDDSAFAQPSGLALSARNLFVADAESNIVRAIALPPVNTVATLAGGDLFEFGDRDGRGDDVRFQHPLGIACHDGQLYVADTYNHKIKVVNPVTREVRMFAGGGEPGIADGRPKRARFHEPGGIAAANGRLFVADTNNHAVRVIDMASAEVTTLAVSGTMPHR